jgi:hypothetical protein
MGVKYVQALIVLYRLKIYIACHIRGRTQYWKLPHIVGSGEGYF